MSPNFDIKILVVDDVPTMSMAIISLLKELGFTNIETAGNGHVALDLIKTNLEAKPFDLILSDWHMPVMTGLNLLKEVRKLKDSNELPFIILTTESSQSRIIDAITLGANDYLLKPAKLDELANKIYSCMGFGGKKSIKKESASVTKEQEQALKDQIKIEREGS